ncbi:MAG: hypothetical protein IKZ53_02650 [Selenomonadaceae bacterium]|nr:hypothetical protein [Selenomonadaceae bacterium]
MWKKFFSEATKKVFLVGFILSIVGVAEAKELPEIVWNKDVYTMTISSDYANADKKRGYQLLNTGTPEEQRQNREKIAQAIADKLAEQSAKLPFKLKTMLDVNDISERNFENELGESPIALVPIIVTDYSIEKEYVINNQHRYKYIIVSSIDIAFCSEDEDGALTILSNIPLHFYESIPLSNSIGDMNKREQAELARIYTDFTVDMIKKHLDFTKAKKAVNGLSDKKFVGETYRVENVSYSSKIAQEVLGMNKLIQRIAGNVFTSDFAALTGNVVYPMILADDNSSWTTDAVQGFYVAKMNTSHSGEKIVRMPTEVDHKIYLDVSGAGNKEIQTKYTSDINGYKMYRLWMESKIDGKTIEITNDVKEEFLKGNSMANRIIKDEQEIYGGLMIGAAVKSALAQAGKKVK